MVAQNKKLVRRRIVQFFLGFVWMYLLALPNIYLTANYFLFFIVLGMFLAGFGWGARETTPIWSSIFFNLAGMLVNVFSIFDGNWHMLPNTVPLHFVAGSLAAYTGIVLRKQQAVRPALFGVVGSFIIGTVVLGYYAAPREAFLYGNEYMNFLSAGIPLQGIERPDMTLPIPGKKVVVLDFWSTKCGACYELKPEITKLAAAWENDPRVQFLSIASSYFDKVEKVKEADYLSIGSKELVHDYFDVTGELAKQVATQGCPVLAFVDAQGRIRLCHRGYSQTSYPVFIDYVDREIKNMLAAQD
jgi:thiol-disulfide isomerase/thioredoxin